VDGKLNYRHAVVFFQISIMPGREGVNDSSFI